MSEKATGKPPRKSPQTRQERLKQALKANIARRKAQARARTSGARPKED